MVSSLMDGVVEVQLGDSVVELKATPSAAIRLSKTYNGLGPILGRLTSLDFETFVNVVKIGGAVKGDALKDIEERVFQVGMVELLNPLVRYVTMLSNGGKENISEDSEPKKERPLQ